VDSLLSPSRYLRALTFDLQGRPPTLDEYQRIEDELETASDDQISGDQIIGQDWIAELLEGTEFAQQATRFHHGMLWNNITNINLYNNRSILNRTQSIYWRNSVATIYRGERVVCLDEPARFGSNGTILTRLQEDGSEREGWVWVNPYWDPENPVKVCAFDAQEAEFSNNGTWCGTNGGSNRSDCGCGLDMKWCVTGSVRNMITRSLGESLDRLVQWVFESGDSYIDLFSSPRFFINGPLVHFFTHHMQRGRYTLSPSPINSDRLPNLNYTDQDQWIPITLGANASGILTHPAYLIRFQTNRARANRFFDAFLCSPFQPPEGGLPVADEESVRNPDLQLRAGCKYCHALLEPAASYWGRWTEQGIAYLEPDQFPSERSDCLTCALTNQGCTNECRTHYLTTALSEQEIPYLGKLKAYTFRRTEHGNNVEQGPKLLAFAEVADQRLPQCVAQRASEWLLGRELNSEQDRLWVNQLGIEFARSGFNYRSLVLSIVQNERYRRVK
jgi:hypothetical protein